MRDPRTMPNSYAFVLIDTTGTIPAAVLQSIAAACQWQAEGDVNNEWGATATMRTDTSVNNVKAGECAFVIKETLPEAPDAVGYHATLPNGSPVAYFALADCSSQTSGDGSLSQCVSHEMCETLGDPGANRFALKKDGQTLQAQELCDRVQDGFYNAPNGVAVSNFLLQSAFDPGAPGPWDKLNQLIIAEGRTSDGYEIDATIGQESQATGAASTAKLTIYTFGTPRKRAAHWSSRLSSRQRQAATRPPER
jgi:hypothetical protein